MSKFYVVSNSYNGKENIYGIYYLFDDTGYIINSDVYASLYSALKNILPEGINKDNVLYLGRDSMTVNKLIELNDNNYKQEVINNLKQSVKDYENCEEIDLEDEDIETYTVTDIHVNCPKCGEVYDEYNIEYEHTYVCRCVNCGHIFSFNYCPY